MEWRLAQLTEDYNLSYNSVKDHLQLKVGPLSKIPKATIRQMIATGRKKLARKTSSIGE